MALIHPVVMIAIKCWGGQSLISAWSLKGNLIPQSKEWKICKCLVFKLYKKLKPIALKRGKS